MNSNSENPKVGKAFQDKVKQWFEANRNTTLISEPHPGNHFTCTVR